jgi:hypothetical protein
LNARTLNNLDRCYARTSPDILFQVIDNEVVLLSMESGEYFGVNEVGARIWVLSNNGQSVGSIVRELLDQYEVTEPDLITHVTKFLSDLESEGLVSIADES